MQRRAGRGRGKSGASSRPCVREAKSERPCSVAVVEQEETFFRLQIDFRRFFLNLKHGKGSPTAVPEFVADGGPRLLLLAKVLRIWFSLTSFWKIISKKIIFSITCTSKQAFRLTSLLNTCTCTCMLLGYMYLRV